jgi:hypothetical protein
LLRLVEFRSFRRFRAFRVSEKGTMDTTDHDRVLVNRVGSSLDPSALICLIRGFFFVSAANKKAPEALGFRSLSFLIEPKRRFQVPVAGRVFAARAGNASM